VLISGSHVETKDFDQTGQAVQAVYAGAGVSYAVLVQQYILPSSILFLFFFTMQAKPCMVFVD